MRTIQKAALAVRAAYSFVDLVRHPEHLQEVFALADSIDLSGGAVLASMRDFFAKDARGATALRAMPRVGAIDLDALGALSEGTLGRAFADHMRNNQLDPKAIPTYEAATEPDYVRAHLYETHDIWHALTGFGADATSEVGLQAFYLAQFPARLAAAILAIGFVNTLLYAIDDRDARMRAVVRGWMLGKRAKPLFGIDWKTMWSRPIDEVRRDLGIDIQGVESVLPN